MTDTNPIIELAKKLHALSERGVGGEKENAGTMLRRLMAKHNITLDDVTSEAVLPRQVPYTTKENRQFVHQVISSVMGRVAVFTVKGRKYFLVDMTTAEHLEIIEKSEHDWRLWEEERALFYSAFIQANQLYSKRSDVEEHGEPPQLTPDELAHLRRLHGLMSQVRTDSPTKRLERPEKLTA